MKRGYVHISGLRMKRGMCIYIIYAHAPFHSQPSKLVTANSDGYIGYPLFIIISITHFGIFQIC